ncbi:MAG: hypothetical protein KF886_17685 [Candidatus Hydrogenedentes bacterium]|nr:hypothetical protein [Candidatus Hydrogenedentota bacterium]
MTGAAAALALLLAAVEITVSPDQPLAYSYVDDPFIVEIRSDAATVANVEVILEPGAEGDAVRQVFPEVSLGPGIDRWCAVKNLPEIRGEWRVTVRVGDGAAIEERQAAVYRIDRPAGAEPHPVYAWGDEISRDTLLALRAAAIDRVRVPASHPEPEVLFTGLAALGMQALVVLDDVENAARTGARLGELGCGAIARWELAATPENAPALPAAIEALQALPCSLPVMLAIGDAADLDAVLAAVDVRDAEHLVLRGDAAGPDALALIRIAFQVRGIEAATLEYLHAGEDPAGLLPACFEARARGAVRIGIPARLFVADGALQSGIGYANTLAHAIPPAGFAAILPQPGAARARLFARGPAWTMALWSTGGDTEIALPWSESAPFTLRDAWGNPRTFGDPDGERWAGTAGASIQFLTGAGGPLLEAALVAETKSTVRAILARRDLAPAWTEAQRETLAAAGDAPDGETSRVHFFALLRGFPDIEDRWHAGRIPRPAAVGAMAELARLTRTLCRLEGARGATFIEPIQDTLARCDEFVSAYLTGATATPQARARGDWLVGEVRRLMDEVEWLLAAGAKAEADAVAALAEWRARGLEHAVKAGPLSDQMALPEPEKQEEPKPTANAKGKKK